MLIRFYVSYNNGRTIKERVWHLAEALQTGAALFGDRVETVHNAEFAGPDPDVDVACCWGIFGNAKQIIESYVGAGKRALMFDKALIRRMGQERYGHFRVSMDGKSPLKYLMREMRSFERWEAHRIEIKPRQELPGRGELVYAGSSQKYCDFHDLGDANVYAESVFEASRKVSHKFFLVYRPKPSWPGAREIEGTRFSDGSGSLSKLLRNAHCLVTHGSAAAVEAIVSGVPVITLGPCIARPVASHSLDELLDPFFPSDAARFHWLCNVAYCQWTLAELRSGEAWDFLRRELAATSANPPLYQSDPRHGGNVEPENIEPGIAGAAGDILSEATARPDNE